MIGKSTVVVVVVVVPAHSLQGHCPTRQQGASRHSYKRGVPFLEVAAAAAAGGRGGEGGRMGGGQATPTSPVLPVLDQQLMGEVFHAAWWGEDGGGEGEEDGEGDRREGGGD